VIYAVRRRIRGRELRIAVGRQIDTGEALVVQAIREGNEAFLVRTGKEKSLFPLLARESVRSCLS